jgi:glucose-6-phosphate 1-epimerase
MSWMVRIWIFHPSCGRKSKLFPSMQSSLEIPGHVTLFADVDGLPKVLVETPWSKAEVYLHGAHVTGFQKKEEQPLLFLSRDSAFAPQKAIRGGVPIIFPWFGGRENKPAHGFARTSEWHLQRTKLLTDQSVSLHFCLPEVEGFEVEYLVVIGEALTMELSIRNTSSLPATFENCLHTYLQVSSIHDISISGLAATRYLNKLNNLQALEISPSLHITGEVDRIYSDTTTTVEIHDPCFNRTIQIEKSGSNSTVVWNPWIEKSKAMPDFGDDEYQQMVCIESGNITPNQITLPAGEHTILKVELRSQKVPS